MNLALFQDIEMQEEDIELGQDLLDKGDSDKDKDKDVEAGDDKDETKEKLQEINIEDNKVFYSNTINNKNDVTQYKWPMIG